MSRTGSAGMDGLKRKNSQGRDPRTQEGKRAYPTAGKELESLVNKHSAIEKIVEIPDEEWEFFRAVQRQ